MKAADMEYPGFNEVTRYKSARYDRPGEWPIIHTAAQVGDVVTIKKQLESGAKINKMFGKRSITPLQLAIRAGKIDAVRVLLENGAKITPTGKKLVNWQPTLRYAIESKHLDIIKALIENGADVNERTGSFERTMLHIAAANGDSDVVAVLIEYGFDINSKDLQEQTPLILAASNQRPEVIKILLDADADITPIDRYGMTAFQHAAGDYDLMSVKLLLAAGADINAVSKHGQSPLEMAILQDSTDIAIFLIESGADVNAPIAKRDSKTIKEFLIYAEENVILWHVYKKENNLGSLEKLKPAIIQEISRYWDILKHFADPPQEFIAAAMIASNGQAAKFIK